MSFALRVALTWLALPVYVIQGLLVRRRAMRMQPPPCSGVYSENTNSKGKELSILVIGDSSAVGVGVDDIADSMGGQLLRILSKRSGRPIRLRISGNNSATSSDLRDYVVPNLPAETFDYISLNIGTNDAKNFHRGSRFCREFGTLLYALRAKFTGATVIWVGVIDLADVPLLPTPLNHILGIRAEVVNRNGRELCRDRGVLAPISNWQVIPENFAQDGFHAGVLGYHRWADELADYILDLEGQTGVATSQAKTKAARVRAH